MGIKIHLADYQGAFNKEFYNYARLVSGMLRQQIEITAVLAIVGGMQFENETLNSWKKWGDQGLKRIYSKTAL